jgi:hypothetical protein
MDICDIDEVEPKFRFSIAHYTLQHANSVLLDAWDSMCLEIVVYKMRYAVPHMQASRLHTLCSREVSVQPW